MRLDIFATLLGTAIVCVAPAAAASPTTFTYQGNLVQNGDPAEGAHEFEIRLLDNLGVQIGMTQSASEIVTAGSFSMELDFGTGAFDGAERYLEISVRSVADGGAYVVLSPNQLVTSAPVAQFALSGNEGPQGPEGVQGLDGPQGAQGVPGSDGSDGGQGPQGDPGDDGTDGAAGGQGPQGDQGDPGDSHWDINGTDTFYTGGEVGIGTSTPAYMLTVRSLVSNVPALYASNNGANSTGVWGIATRSNSTNFGVRGTTVSPSGYAGYFEGGRNYFEGNVGIGTDNPLYPLHIDTTSFRAFSSLTSGFSAGRFETTQANGFAIVGVSSATTGQGQGGQFEAFGPNSIGVVGHGKSTTGSAYGVYGRTDSVAGTGVYGYASSSSVGSNAAAIHGRVNSDSAYAGYFDGGKNYFEGYVGVGTTTPSDQFHINAPDGENAFRVQTNGLTRIRVNALGGVSLGGNSTVVADGSTYVVNNLGIGDSTPEERLDVVGNGVISGRLTVATSTPQTSFGLAVAGSAAKTGGGTWSVFSDQRLKKNIVPMTGSLDLVSALRPVSFEYTAKDHFSYTPGVQRGFIAQEVQQVIPQWVNTADDGYFYLDQVGYEALVVDAIQELRAEKDAEIEKLQSENIELKARLDRIEHMLRIHSAR